MRKELSKYASGEVPRYTSYPTAAQFHNGIGEAQYRDWLDGLAPDARVSLYIHVPFCEKLCWYCGCHTTVAREYERIHTYVASLLREIDLLADALPHKARVCHIHFGGGTPSLLLPGDMTRIMDLIADRFQIDPAAEIAIEVDPRTLDEPKVRQFAHVGVTRASLGVQDFGPHIQAKINRIQPFYVVARSVEMLRAAGVRAINFDLMYGLPSQKIADVERSAELATWLHPDRVAVFGYAHVPWFKKHQRMIEESELPGPSDRFKQAEAAAKVLVAQGFEEVGLDHFARKADPLAVAARERKLRRNFQGYTNDPADVLLGLGASSIGALPVGFAQNAPGLDVYRDHVMDGRLPVVRGVTLSSEDRLRAAAIERIMCDMALDVGALCRAHGQEATSLDAALSAMNPLAADGLVTIAERLVSVTADGRRFLRNIAACFDAYWQPQPKRHSLAV